MKKDKNLLTVQFRDCDIINTIDMEKGIIYGMRGKPIKKLSKGYKNIIVENEFDRKVCNLFEYFGVEKALPFLSLLDKIMGVGLYVQDHSIEELKRIENQIKLTRDFVSYCLQHHNSHISARVVKEFEIVKAKPQETSALLNEINLSNLYDISVEHQAPIDYVVDLAYKVFIRENLKVVIGSYDLHNMMRRFVRYMTDLDKPLTIPKNFIKDSISLTIEYQTMRDEVEKKKFQKVYSKNYETQIGDYVIVQPKSPSDIVDEGKNQNNCVANYVSDVINGYCVILFMRHRDTPNKSFITFEIRNKKVYQAKRQFNNNINDDEKIILSEYEKFLEKMSA